jgi:hypothetical protein
MVSHGLSSDIKLPDYQAPICLLRDRQEAGMAMYFRQSIFVKKNITLLIEMAKITTKIRQIRTLGYIRDRISTSKE